MNEDGPKPPARRMPAESLPPDPEGVAFERTARLAELGVLTASLVHELRQPLMALKGSVQLAHRGVMPLEPNVLLDQLQHLEDLLDHYAGFARVEEIPRRFDLRSPVERAVDLFRRRANRRRVTLDVGLPAEPVMVLGRRTALQQVVVNLLHNALDAVTSDPGGGSIAITCEASGGRIQLGIVDDGPGIAPEVAERLFEPFVTSKPAGQGTGLGLHIARRMIDEMGGTLTMQAATQDRTRPGARVCIELPAA